MFPVVPPFSRFFRFSFSFSLKLFTDIKLNISSRQFAKRMSFADLTMTALNLVGLICYFFGLVYLHWIEFALCERKKGRKHLLRQVRFSLSFTITHNIERCSNIHWVNQTRLRHSFHFTKGKTYFDHIWLAKNIHYSIYISKYNSNLFWFDRFTLPRRLI